MLLDHTNTSWVHLWFHDECILSSHLYWWDPTYFTAQFIFIHILICIYELTHPRALPSWIYNYLRAAAAPNISAATTATPRDASRPHDRPASPTPWNLEMSLHSSSISYHSRSWYYIREMIGLALVLNKNMHCYYMKASECAMDAWYATYLLQSNKHEP